MSQLCKINYNILFVFTLSEQQHTDRAGHPHEVAVLWMWENKVMQQMLMSVLLHVTCDSLEKNTFIVFNNNN